MSIRVRPTIACLKKNGIALPPVDRLISDLKLPVIKAAQRVPNQIGAAQDVRIVSVSDGRWYKVKTGQNRGAVTTVERHEIPSRDVKIPTVLFADYFAWWFCAVGIRKDGDVDDFYAEFTQSCRTSKTMSTPKGVDSSQYLPTDLDGKRIQAELGFIIDADRRAMMIRLAAQSIKTKMTMAGQLLESHYSVFVEASAEESFVALSCDGYPDPGTIACLMDSLPGVEKDDWGPEPGGIGGLQPEPGQIVWSAPITDEAIQIIIDACENLGHTD